MTTAMQVHQPAQSSILPHETEWQTILQMSATLVKSGLLPTTIKTPEAAAAVILKGRELAIPPMQAFSHIYVLQGKPSCSAELQLSLLARGGVTWTFPAAGNTDDTATIVLDRPGFDPCTASFTLVEAAAAGLTRNPTWKSYPKAMLRARAISIGARMIGPDLLCGMSYTPEEMGAHVDEEGQPVEVEVVVNGTKTAKEKMPEMSPLPEPGPVAARKMVEEIFDGEVVESPYLDYLEAAKAKAKALGLERYRRILKEFDLGSAKDIDEEDVASQEALIAALVAEADHDSTPVEMEV